jgi:hypothetical protein
MANFDSMTEPKPALTLSLLLESTTYMDDSVIK